MTYLNVDVLFARILNKEGKGILPHRAVGPIASLQKRRENISCYELENYAQFEQFDVPKKVKVTLPCSL